MTESGGVPRLPRQVLPILGCKLVAHVLLQLCIHVLGRVQELAVHSRCVLLAAATIHIPCPASS